MTPRKILLYLSAAGLHARSWQNGELSAPMHFARTPAGRERFAEFLQARHAPALLLADLIEEDFRHEAVPHLHGSDRSSLIRRKLEQYYRDTPFRQATILPHRKEGKENDGELLLSALTNPSLILPWLGIMQTQGAPLAGIYSIPHISARLMKGASADGLLLSWEKHAGLRQTYFVAGALRFSRLTPMNDDDSFGAIAKAETARTRQYLDNLSLLPPDKSLDAYIVCHRYERHELEAQLGGDASVHCRYLDIEQLGRLARSRTACSDSDATPLFLHLLARYTPRNNYATAGHTRYLRMSLARRTLLGTSTTAAAVSLLWAAANVLTGMEVGRQSHVLDMQAVKLVQQTRQITRNFPDALAPASEMKGAVLLARKLYLHASAPQEILRGLSKTLDDFPDIRINKLSWKTHTLTTGPTDPADVSAPTITLDGELVKPNRDFRDMLEQLKRFRQALVQRGYAVTPLSLPLDTRPEGSISASLLAEDRLSARFSLKLMWRTA